MHFLALTSLVTLSAAFQFPSWIPFVQSADPQAVFDVPTVSTTNRVAIIGAGAAGSSAAFWIGKARERYGLDVEVDLFEKSGLIGGRSTVVHPHDDPSLVPMELGASIFVRANKNLWRATEEFNLSLVDFGDEEQETGIWDGEGFVFRIGSGSGWIGSWWNSLKVVWRYGYRAPTKTQAMVDEMVKRFLTLYSREVGTEPWSNITDISEKLGWADLTAQTAAEYLDQQGIDRRWTRELVEAATRVNYGQDIDKIQALEGLVSLAATGASSVAGGNFQIFEHFVHHSKAHVHLNTTVTSLSRASNGLWTLHTPSSTQDYRAVILAAPFHSTGLTLPAALASQIPPQPYVKLHVTLLSTTASSSNPAYFDLGASEVVPQTILTTAEGVRDERTPPEFNSMTFHGKVARRDGGERDVDEHLVKVFSEQPVEQEWLEELFGKEQVTWVHRRLFEAYPVLPPTTTFPPVKLDEGLYYVNAFEPLISTMETETIAARNVVSLLLADVFDSAICKLDNTNTDNTKDADTSAGPITSERQSGSDPEYVFGWDC